MTDPIKYKTFMLAVKKFLFPLLWTFPCFISAQSLNSLSSELFGLKSQYRNLLNRYENVDEFKDAVEELHRKIDNLKDDIEDAESDLGKSTALTNLMNEADEFESFTGNSYTCECLSYFNNIVRDLGGSPVLLKEHNGVRILSVRLGNFIFYYAYALENNLYKLKLEMSASSGPYSYANSSNSFGLMNEIEVFDIAPAANPKVLKSVDVQLSSSGGYAPSKCKGEIGRETK